ncbi:MAG: hypothetical protein AABZ39_12165 [Spirochaetota bacterium]
MLDDVLGEPLCRDAIRSIISDIPMQFVADPEIAADELEQKPVYDMEMTDIAFHGQMLVVKMNRGKPPMTVRRQFFLDLSVYGLKEALLYLFAGGNGIRMPKHAAASALESFTHIAAEFSRHAGAVRRRVEGLYGAYTSSGRDINEHVAIVKIIAIEGIMLGGDPWKG